MLNESQSKTSEASLLNYGGSGPNDSINRGGSTAPSKARNQHIRTKICPDEETCMSAHELQLSKRADLAKTKLCQQYAKGSCMNGNKCNFAHGNGELRKPCSKGTLHSSVTQFGRRSN